MAVPASSPISSVVMDIVLISKDGSTRRGARRGYLPTYRLCIPWEWRMTYFFPLFWGTLV